jgi:CrcB protein
MRSLKALGMTLTASSPLAASALVAAGGAVGAVARFQLGRLATHLTGPTNAFPWGTLSVNLIGSLAMGALLGWFARGQVAAETAETMRLLIGVGLLGGFTTFSAFSAELVTMLHRGQMIDALLYGSVSLVAGMAALAAGLIIAQSVS